MTSNKKLKSAISIYAIVAFVFIFLTLIIPFNKPAASWIMFGFSIVAIVGGCGISLFAFGKSPELKSKFYGYPLFRIGFLYTVAQLALTVVLYIIGAFVAVPYWIALCLCVLIIGTAAIGTIAVDNARDFVEDIEINSAVKTKVVKRFYVDISEVLDACKDQEVYEPLKKLVEKFKYSDVVSCDETAVIEEQIKLEINELKGMIVTESTEVVIAKVEKISNLLSSRNRQCEMAKHN